MLESDRTLIDEQAERIAALEATNAKMWADFDVLKATVLANERAKDAEIERLRAALKGIAEYCSGDDRTLGAVARLTAIRNTAEQAARADEQREP